MKKLILALPFCLVLASTEAEARNFTFPATICQPVASQTGCVDKGQYGVNNICQFTVTVDCPLPVSTPQTGSPSLSGGYFIAYDRSPSADISCTLYMADFKGDIWHQQTLSTSSYGVPSIRKDFASTPFLSGWWHLQCTLPTATSSGVSHLTTILLTTTE